jgi:predicted phage tail protein
VTEAVGKAGAFVAVGEGGAVVAVPLLTDVLVGEGLAMIWNGSAQLIIRMARTINTVNNFRVIPILLSISYLLSYE